MKIRKRILSEGWYPNSKSEIEALLTDWVSRCSPEHIHAGIVPHAGWAFCGSIIAQVIARLPEDINTIVVLGGHNPPGKPFISYHEDEWITPTGIFSADREFSEHVESSYSGQWVEETSADNTVEVVMVMALALRPEVKWSAWRIPSDERAIDFGEKLAMAAEISGRHLAVLGSTDLTHYGPQYGFTPPDSLNDPVQWVKERDSQMIDALVNFDGASALKAANFNQCACSGGGAVATMSYAKTRGAIQGRRLSYRTSRDIYHGDSFVGYTGLVWE